MELCFVLFFLAVGPGQRTQLASLPEASSMPAIPHGFIDEAASQSAVVVPAENESELEVPPAAASSGHAWYQGVTIGGFIDADFAAAWAAGVKPQGQNTFVVGEVEADIEKKFLDVARLRLDVNVYNQRPWTVTPGNSYFSSAATFFDYLVEQAYGEWYPLGEAGPRLRLGKYNALIGYERQDAPDRLTTTESLTFVNGSPANFTGFAIDIPLPAELSLTLHAAFNGWDQGFADKTSKSFGAQLAFVHPTKSHYQLRLAASYLYGDEQPLNVHDARQTGFFMASFIPGVGSRLHLLFASEMTYGEEAGLGRNAQGAVTDKLPAWWYGLSVWLSYAWLDWLTTTLRYDYFTDPSMVRGLNETINVVPTSTTFMNRQEFTGNISATVTHGFTLRIEYNADWLYGQVASSPALNLLAHRLLAQGVFAW